ncbi:hypothetical protein BB559_001698 [Furculomyces boomerangus]|uniref:Uncharacterized protein n=1 Tax=Furculomyces boomerangus TaxID=61424 RepID=A0A2T9Z122_9FUNG|nr:hypothetical protein BB559_001698 [Furculomyces boomerangus]
MRGNYRGRGNYHKRFDGNQRDGFRGKVNEGRITKQQNHLDTPQNQQWSPQDEISIDNRNSHEFDSSYESPLENDEDKTTKLDLIDIKIQDIQTKRLQVLSQKFAGGGDNSGNMMEKTSNWQKQPISEQKQNSNYNSYEKPGFTNQKHNYQNNQNQWKVWQNKDQRNFRGRFGNQNPNYKNDKMGQDQSNDNSAKSQMQNTKPLDRGYIKVKLTNPHLLPVWKPYTVPPISRQELSTSGEFIPGPFSPILQPASIDILENAMKPLHNELLQKNEDFAQHQRVKALLSHAGSTTPGTYIGKISQNNNTLIPVLPRVENLK